MACRPFERPVWVDRAACRGISARVFFIQGRGSNGDDYREARAICARCPVRSECLDLALRQHEHQGVWGGLTTHERRAVRRIRNSNRNNKTGRKTA